MKPLHILLRDAGKRRKTQPMAREKRKHTDRESPLQASLVAWFRLVVSPTDAKIAAVPNGIHTTKSQGAKAKWMGAEAGWPDLLIAITGNYTIWVEVKVPKGEDYAAGVLSEDQKACHADLRALGHIVEVVHSIDELRAVLTRHRIPTREAN